MPRQPASLCRPGASIDLRQRVGMCFRRSTDFEPSGTSMLYPSSKRNRYALSRNARRREARVSASHDAASNNNNAHSKRTFSEEDYHRARLKYVVPTIGMPDEGCIMLTKYEDGTHPVDDKHTLVMTVVGDTFTALVNLVKGKGACRPSSLNLLGSILDEIKLRQSVQLSHVAVTHLQNNTFHGRLFFSAVKTDGELAQWDCDSRASDAVWLAINENVPIYVNRDVWDQVSLPLGSVVNRRSTNNNTNASGGNHDSLSWQEQTADGQTGSHQAEVPASTTPTPSPVVNLIPESIQRLKREMAVAIAEEDYKTAAKIRDHPFMQLYALIEQAEKEGRVVHSKRLRDDLSAFIAQQYNLTLRHEEEWQNLTRASPLSDFNGTEQLGSAS
eukprot:1183003-Prorocentrum_minimum.AAC.4